MGNENQPRTTLADLKEVGSRGCILDVSGDDAVAIRLMEMGLTEDEEIEVIGFAPLGDPIEYSIRGYRISLRSTEAARVSIRSI
ncbi:FeoA family protein [Thalassoglobus sp.]|uniref:FeoA family protein n=1 Tax=Thalassoglobus sp. TaxID=2795869 RepID=UPI003AA9A929